MRNAVRYETAYDPPGVVVPFPRARIRRAHVDTADALLDLIGTIRHAGLRRYCLDRINSARDIEEVAATVKFVHQVTGTRP